MKLKKLLATLIALLATSASFANIGYVKYQIINNTPDDYYVTLRQQFMYPIEACQGVVAPNSTKECDGKLELGYSTFYLHAIKELTRESKFELKRNIAETQNVLMTFTLDMDKDNSLRVSSKIQPL